MINGTSQTDVVLIKDPDYEIEDFIMYMINGASQTDRDAPEWRNEEQIEGEYRQRPSSETKTEETSVPQRAPKRFKNKERTYSW